MTRLQELRHRLLVLSTLACSACAGDPAEFNVKYGQGFPRRATTISVFGVFRDGRMSPESWASVGPALSLALGKPSCEIVYDTRLEHENPQLFAAIDDETKADGVTEDLLEKLAPMASGEMIMTIYVHGRAGAKAASDDDSEPLPIAGFGKQTGGMRASRGRGQGPPGQGPPAGARGSRPRPGKMRDDRALEISASLFSVRLGHGVGRLHMTYTGTSLEDAVNRFARKLDSIVPGSTCRGWRLPSSPSSLASPDSPAAPGSPVSPVAP